jgi:hypothetical protein
VVSCVLWLLLTAAAWGYMRVIAGRIASTAVAADLARAERLAASVHRERLNGVALTARLVASFPELRALLATDAATVRDYLVSYQQRNPGSPVLFALSPDGTVLARTDDRREPIGEWMEALSSGQPAIVQAGDGFYHAAISAVEAGGTEFGRILAASPVDRLFAVALREATEHEVVLATDSAIVTSTLPANQIPWRSGAEWRQPGGGESAIDVTIGSEQFAAREFVLAAKPPLAVMLLRSKDEALAPYGPVQDAVVAIGLFCLLAGTAWSFWITRAVRSSA